MILKFILIIIGFILLLKGANLLVDGGSNIAKKFHIPEIVIGLTIVSIGTSMPELVVSITSAIQGHPDMAIGSIIGSNIANLFLILGVCATIRNLKFQKETRKVQNPIILSATIALLILANNKWNGQANIITRIEGICLVIASIIFILYNITISKKDNRNYLEPLVKINVKYKEDMYVIKPIISIGLGIVGLKLGGDLIINNSVTLASMLGMSEKLISLTILTIATSLPELITSITATVKKETDMAIGNVLGSQIFNILLIIGTSAMIVPIDYSISYNKDLALLVAGVILLAIFPYVGKKNEMTRLNGILYLGIYLLYFINLIITV